MKKILAVFAILGIVLFLGCSRDRAFHYGEQPESVSMLVNSHGWDVLKQTSKSNYRQVDFDRLWLEFSDDLTLHDPGQLKRAKEHIETLSHSSSTGVYVVVFAHGHNQNADNSAGADKRGRSGWDAVKFDYVLARHAEHLRRLYEMRGAGEPPKVVGVFIGWRGNTTKILGLRRLTLGNRAAKADALGAERELESIYHVLKRLRTALSSGSASNKMVIYGHSLGGRILSAMHMEAFKEDDYHPFGTNTLAVALQTAMGADCFADYFDQNAPRLEIGQDPSFWLFTSDEDIALESLYPRAARFGLVRPCIPNDLRGETAIGLHKDFVTHELKILDDKVLEDAAVYNRMRQADPDVAFPQINATPWTQRFGTRTLTYPMRDLKCSLSPSRCFDPGHVLIYQIEFSSTEVAARQPVLWNIETDTTFVDVQGAAAGSIQSTHNGYVSTNLSRLIIDYQFQ